MSPLRTAGLIGFFFAFLAIGSGCLHAQVLEEFDMSDTTITLCRGILYDSGGEDGIYPINENVTTVIETGGVITLTFFNEFCFETGLDFLLVYDGNSAAAPLIGTFSGTNLPSALIAASGAVTLVLTSDPNVSYCGFSLEWETEVPPPIPPEIEVAPLPACNDDQVSIAFSYEVQCEWLTTAEWSFSRNGEDIAVENVEPGCVNGETSVITLTLAAPIVSNCPYTATVVMQIPDACDVLHTFTIVTSFDYSGCGVDIEATALEPTVCPGQCTTVSAIVDGCFTYTYLWDQGVGSGPGPHSVCPAVPTLYTVTVTEVETGAVSTASVQVGIESGAIATLDQTICQSVDDIVMEADTDGEWWGDGLEFETTVFDPDSVIGGGLTYVYFQSENCLDSVRFDIVPIQTDDIIAACPESPDFTLNSQPGSGTWSGPFTTVSGIFSPVTAGTYTVTYTLGACTDLLTVNVDSIEGVFLLDTICQSVWTDTIQFSPPGGYWSGPGVLDSLLGVYVPSSIAPGDVSWLYTINGCTQTAQGYIKEIDIGPSFTTACPQEQPLVWYEAPSPRPPGGVWTGDGIINAASGLFDPLLFPSDTYTSILYNAPNGCSDTTVIWVIQTQIGPDTIFFCDSDRDLRLNQDNIGVRPEWGGQWTGNGLLEPNDDEWYFDPGLAGVGFHTLYYLRNNCTDSMVMAVYPTQLPQGSYSFCSTAPGEFLAPGISGGIWSPIAGLNTGNGFFDPGEADPGEYYIYWTNEAGCSDSIFIQLEQLPPANISGLQNVYCVSDIDYDFTSTPEGGLLTGIDPSPFNPASYGPGTYAVNYTVVGTNCVSSTQLTITVYPGLETTLQASDTLLCSGQSATLEIVATTGAPDPQWTYTWSHGAFPVSTTTVVPSQSQWYAVTTGDGCSEPITDSVFIEVLPRTEVDVLTSDLLCFGDTGFVQAQVVTPGSFLVYWNGVEGESAAVLAGSTQSLQVIDQVNGCVLDSSIFVPVYPPVIANFSINPNLECIPFDQSGSIGFIDFSQNATSGTWTFGNGNSAGYGAGSVSAQSYPSPGAYTVTLLISNEGGCTDSTSRSVCILPPTPIFIPDIFSPNGDGNNDVFFVRSRGVIAMQLDIYNRWGERVFRSTSPDSGWDGNYLSKPAMAGGYLYFLKATLNNGDVQEMKGELTLVR
jgi:gliding motility-associated-like protein